MKNKNILPVICRTYPDGSHDILFPTEQATNTRGTVEILTGSAHAQQYAHVHGDYQAVIMRTRPADPQAVAWLLKIAQDEENTLGEARQLEVRKRFKFKY